MTLVAARVTPQRRALPGPAGLPPRPEEPKRADRCYPGMMSPQFLVLLVEDDDDLRDMVQTALAGAGCRVVAASNGEEALRLLSQDDEIALLFTDIRMPGRLDGVALAREAKQRRPDLKVLYTTAYAETLPSEALGPTGDSPLRKPYRLSELRRRVRGLLDS